MNHRHSEREATRSGKIVDHAIPHPDGSLSHRSWSHDQTLHVAAVYSNPCRWRTRRVLFNSFRRHMESLPNVRLYVGELAYGDRPFEVTCESHPLDFQWRTREILWHKENLLNLVIGQFDHGWEYGAYVDGDFHFTRNDIGLETIQELQRYEWVQMYSTYTDLSPDHRPMRIMKSFGQRFVDQELTAERLAEATRGGDCSSIPSRRSVGTTGGGWAFRRESFEACGGLLDVCVLGSADWHMAFGLIGYPDTQLTRFKPPTTTEVVKCGAAYAHAIEIWQRRAAQAVRRNVGVVNCSAVHYFHGSKSRRGYGTRWRILRDHDYNPSLDLHRDGRGIYQLTPEKPDFRDAIRRYFFSRSEDDISLGPNDKLLGE